MRRITRIENPIFRVLPKTSTTTPFICASCVRQKASFSTTGRAVAPANEQTPFTEKIRRRIWGTDTPPGQADPYGPGSYVNEIRERNLAKQAARGKKTGTPVKPTFEGLYEPAESWDGLESVGGRGVWWRSDRWEPEFSGFIPPQQITDQYELTAALHRAIVEVFTLQQAQWPLSTLSSNIPTEDVTGEVQIVTSASGQGAQLQYTENSSYEAILQSLEHTNPNPTESEQDVDADRSPEDPLHEEIREVPPEDETAEHTNPTESEEDVAADRSEVDPLHEEEKLLRAIDHQHQVASWDPVWLGISLENPEIKFAVVKRVMQLTGHRIPDVKIRTVSTVSDLLDHLVVPPKPAKLVDVLVQKGDLLEMPNVKIYNRRVTPIDKETSLGRWKIIEKELQRRGLPVTGHLRKTGQRFV